MVSAKCDTSKRLTAISWSARRSNGASTRHWLERVAARDAEVGPPQWKVSTYGVREASAASIAVGGARVCTPCTCTRSQSPRTIAPARPGET